MRAWSDLEPSRRGLRKFHAWRADEEVESCEGGEPRCGTVVKAFEGEPKAGERDHFVAET